MISLRIMLVVSSIMLLTVFVYAVGEGQEGPVAAFGPVYLVLAAGVSASFITATRSTCPWRSS